MEIDDGDGVLRDVLARAEANREQLFAHVARTARRDMVLTVSSIGHRAVAGATGGLWRLSAAQPGSAPTSLVVKRLVPPAGESERWQASSDPGDPFFWEREAQAYGSGFFGDEALGIRAARCYLVDRRADSTDLYLEDVEGCSGRTWTIEHYARAAARLGHYQATAIALPREAPWLRGRAFLEVYVERRAEFCVNAEALCALPAPALEREALREHANAIRLLWEARGRIFSYFASLPATRCHNDFWSPNLFESPGELVSPSGLCASPGGSTTVAIDLAYAGLGPPGHDAANLVADAVLDFFISADLAQPLWEAVAAAYRAAITRELGLAAADVAVRVMELTAALKFAWLIPATFRLASTPDGVERIARTYGDPAAFFRKRAAALRFIATFLERAPNLLSAIG